MTKKKILFTNTKMTMQKHSPTNIQQYFIPLTYTRILLRKDTKRQKEYESKIKNSRVLKKRFAIGLPRDLFLTRLLFCN